MMNTKKIAILFLLIFILFSAISVISADDDKSYTIDQAFINLTVMDNGLLSVDEIYQFSNKYL